MDYINEFKDEMIKHGITPPSDIIPDGNIYRFDTHKRGGKAGWYVFFGYAGVFGDWSKDLKVRYIPNYEHVPIDDQRRIKEKTDEAFKTAENNLVKAHEEAAEKAERLFSQSTLTGSSTYLERKQVKAYGIKLNGDSIVIPITNVEGKLRSLQFIQPDGDKKFLSFGEKKACFHVIGNIEDSHILVAEGYATGASIYEATGITTAIAFDCGNIEPVVEALLKKWPQKKITIAADNDQYKPDVGNVGLEKATEVSKKLNCQFVYPIFDDLSTQPTDFNDLHVLKGLEEVRSQIESQMNGYGTWLKPRPLQYYLKDVEALPLSIVPSIFQDWLYSISKNKNSPIDYAAVASMIMVGSLIGTRCAIRPKRKDNWLVVPNLWGFIIGRPSVLKSPVMSDVLNPLYRIEYESQKAYKKELEEYANAEERYKDQHAKKSGKKVELIGPAIQKPIKPIERRYTTNDATIEKLAEILSNNPQGILIFRDELMGFLRSFEKGGHEGDRAFYLEGWNGTGGFKTDRIARGSIYTEHVCISIFGSTQPDKLESYIFENATGANNDGFLQRFQLMVYPDIQQEWKLVDEAPDMAIRYKIDNVLEKIANINDFMEWGAVRDDYTKFPYFHFSSEAQEYFNSWLEVLHRDKLLKEENPLIEEHLAKYKSLLPSLSLILHLLEIAEGISRPGPIPLETLKKADAWCQYLESHARRIYGISEGKGVRSAVHILKKIRAGKLKDGFSIRDIYRKGWCGLETPDLALLACEELVEVGYLKAQDVISGHKTKTQYIMHPNLKKEDKSD